MSGKKNRAELDFVVSALLIYFVVTKQTFQSMGKSSNFIGQPLFNQLIKLISRQKIQEIAQKGGYNRYVKRFDGYSHLVTLLFAVFSRYDSLREIVLGLMSEANKLSHLGLSR